MKELIHCSLSKINDVDEDNLQEEIKNRRNKYSSYIMTSKGVHDYVGGEQLDYPWDNGYRFNTKGNKVIKMFDLRENSYNGLYGRKIKSYRCLNEC